MTELQLKIPKYHGARLSNQQFLSLTVALFTIQNQYLIFPSIMEQKY